MYFSRIFIIASLLFTNVLVAPAAAQQQENIVLLPIEVSPEYANQENLIGVALQQSLSKNFNVFYGDSVEAALQAEYAKEDCSAEACVQNIAILFNGEIIVDASLQLVEKSTFLSVQFRNVITGELEAVVQDSCDNCSFTELVKFIDRRTDNVQLKSSKGLTAILKDAPEPEERLVKRDPVQVPKKDVVLPQQTERQKPTKVASPSYWKWGLGALVLGAAGGGGGGGGSQETLAGVSRVLVLGDLAGVSDAGFSQLLPTSHDLVDEDLTTYVDWNMQGQVAVWTNSYNSGSGAAQYVDKNVGTGAHRIYIRGRQQGIIDWICVDCGDDLYDDDVGLFDNQINDINVSWQQSDSGQVITHFYKRVDNKNYDVFLSTPGHVIDYAIFGFTDFQSDGGNFDRSIRTLVYGSPTSSIEGSSIPDAGEFTFSGWSIGRYVVNSSPKKISSEVGLDVDYTNQTFSITFTNSRFNEAFAYPSLDFSASGTVNGTALNATTINRPSHFSSSFGGQGISIQAFGPNSENYAGSFNFNQAGSSIYMGAFGVER